MGLELAQLYPEVGPATIAKTFPAVQMSAVVPAYVRGL